MAGMFGKLRVRLVKGLIELNERYVFERRIARAYRNLLGSPPCQVIDVGANNGQTIEFFLRMSPDCVVHALEPNRRLFEGLQARYGGRPNIRLHEVGASDSNGERTFNENILDYTSTFEEVDLGSDYLQKKSRVLGVAPDKLVTARYPVRTVALSSFIAEHVQGAVDVIKIDVEGHEHACLVGLLNGTVPVPVNFIQLEHHKDDMYANKAGMAEMDALLKAHGYILKATIPHGFGELDEVIYGRMGPTP